MEEIVFTKCPYNIYWKDPEKELPPFRELVWCFMTDIGNEEEGWGYVAIGFYDDISSCFSLHPSSGWMQWDGLEKLNVKKWAYIDKPECPYKYDTSKKN